MHNYIIVMDIVNKDINNFLFESIKNDKTLSDILARTAYPSIVKKLQQHLGWHILHSFSVFYPTQPSAFQKTNAITIIKLIKFRFSFCVSCSNNNKDTFIDDYDLNNAVSTRNELIIFFMKYHAFINKNFVNPLYDETIYTVDSIINTYTNDYRQYLKFKYNVDLNDMIDDSTIENYENHLKLTFDRMNMKIYEEMRKLNIDVSIQLNF